MRSDVLGVSSIRMRRCRTLGEDVLSAGWAPAPLHRPTDYCSARVSKPWCSTQRTAWLRVCTPILAYALRI
jgi:hypothetical protein